MHLGWQPLLLLTLTITSGWALTRYGPANFEAPLLLWFRTTSDTGQLAGPPWMTAFWLGLSWLGDTKPRIVVAVLTILWLLRLRPWHSALFMAGVLLSGIALSSTLKHWVGRPRPQLVAHLDHVTSLSFPSGHALNSTLFYLTVAALLARLVQHRGQRWSLYLAAASLSLATGLSRIALGVHYPTDVMAGWVISAAWLWLWLIVAELYWPKALP